MHVVEISDDLTIRGCVEVLHRNLDDKVVQARFRRFHVPEMEPPYLPLLFKEVAQGQHELPIHVVFGAIIGPGPKRQRCFRPTTLGLEMLASRKSR